MKTQEELRKFVKKKLKNGYPEGELINELLHEGYTKEEIQKVIYEPIADDGSAKHSQQKSNYPIWFVLTSAAGVVGLSLVSVSILRNRMLGYGLLVIGLIGLLVKFMLPIIKDQNKK